VNPLKTDILPDAAKGELLSFYEYLVFKYVTREETQQPSFRETRKNLEAFHRFKKLRDRLNPVIDESLNIDRLIDEVNSDIF